MGNMENSASFGEAIYFVKCKITRGGLLCVSLVFGVMSVLTCPFSYEYEMENVSGSQVCVHYW